jgi:hypothetical protein
MLQRQLTIAIFSLITLFSATAFADIFFKGDTKNFILTEKEDHDVFLLSDYTSGINFSKCEVTGSAAECTQFAFISENALNNFNSLTMKDLNQLEQNEKDVLAILSSPEVINNENHRGMYGEVPDVACNFFVYNTNSLLEKKLKSFFKQTNSQKVFTSSRKFIKLTDEQKTLLEKN